MEIPALESREVYSTQKPREQKRSSLLQDLRNTRQLSSNDDTFLPRPFESWFEVDVAIHILEKGYELVPQYEVGPYRIDLIIADGTQQLAIECDGDQWHGPEQHEYDMQRQRQLERCGWNFVRIRGSSFYANQAEALKPLWNKIEQLGIRPLHSFEDIN